MKINESVSLTRLLQGLLTTFQHVDNSTALTTAMYLKEGCPKIVNPSDIPTKEADLTPFVSHWKQIRDDMLLCRCHFVSESNYEYFKQTPSVMKYLQSEDMYLEKAVLHSSDHHLVGFLVNVVPEEHSLAVKQERFENILQGAPAFQLVMRKLTMKENSKLWCNVLKIRVDRADSDEVSLAFSAAAAKYMEFKYYPFDEYTSLHMNQKRFIIETQRTFLVQNRSIVVDWSLRDVPEFKMWMEEPDKDATDIEEEGWQEDAMEGEILFTQEPVLKPTKKSTKNGNKKRELEENGHEDTEVVDKHMKKHKNMLKPVIVHNLDLRVTSIEDFLYSYKAGDGTPLVRYIYDVTDGLWELLVPRTKRAEVNSLMKHLHRELARHMSDYSRNLVFENAQELCDEINTSSQWRPSHVSATVPHSIPPTTPSNNEGSNKRRNVATTSVNKNHQATWNISHPQTLSGMPVDPKLVSSDTTTQTVAQVSSLHTNASGYPILANGIQEEVNRLKEQFNILEKQQTKLHDNVQQMAKQHKEDSGAIHQMIQSSRETLQGQMLEVVSNNNKELIKGIAAQYSSSIEQIRKDTIALDQRQQQATRHLKTELSGDIAAAIATLTNVVSDMKVDQDKFIHDYNMDKETTNAVIKDQIALFFNNVTAANSPMEIVEPNQEVNTPTFHLVTTSIQKSTVLFYS